MTLFAFSLVFAAAFIHASWNFLSKRVAGGVPFLWLVTLISIIGYFPLALAILLWQQPVIGRDQLIFIVGTGIIHVLYFITLQRGYQVGDLSVVYPLARGTGPMLSTLGAIFFLGERPSWLALIGALLVIGGVFVISSGGGSGKTLNARWAIGYGLLTGVLIASYTLWDRQAVRVYLVPPLLLDYGSQFVRLISLSPSTAKRWDEVKKHWRDDRWATIGVALLNPFSYILVLTAMQTTPVSYVAPAREMSILIGALLGARLLAEGQVQRRLFAAVAIVAGVVALALG